MIRKNPDSQTIAGIIAESNHHAAKWLKVLSTGDIYFWPAEEMFHRQAANKLGINERYDKGIAVI